MRDPQARTLFTTERSPAASGLDAAALVRLLDLVPDALFCMDREWRITYANAASQRLGRITPADFNNRTHWEIYPESVGTPAEALYREVMGSGVASSIEYHYPPFDLWIEIHAAPAPEGIAVRYRDISDRKRSEAVRDTFARQLEQVLDATTDAVVSLDRQWNYIFLNRSAVALLGRDDLLGKNLWQEFPSSDEDGFIKPLHRTMNDRVACEFEAINPPPLNRRFAVQCRPSDDGIVVFFRDVTDERAAQQILLEQEATLSFVKQAARVATWQIDLANEAMSFGADSFPVFGRPCSEIAQLDHFRALVHPDDRAKVRASAAQAIETRSTTNVDYRVIATDGSVLWVEGRGLALFDKEGAATHLRGMTTDVTARKRNEEELRASEARYRVLTDLNPQGIWMGLPDGRIAYANQGFLDYIGKTPDEIAGLGWLDAFDSTEHERVIAAWTHSVQTGEEYALEARLIRATDGASRWWSLRALPIRDDSGAIVQWLGVANDIHEAKTSAEALRQKQEETERQHAELETVYRTAPIGLALFDPIEFRYLRLNDRQAEIVGKPPEDILGSIVTQTAPITGLREMFEQVAAGHPIQDHMLEGELPSRPGEHRYWNVNYFPVYAPDGSVQAIAAASLEITHQKRSELALIQSEKLAAVGRLASSISHEINNPLEAITNLLYLIAQDGHLPETLKIYVHMAQSELTRVSQIVTQTLRFHRQAVAPTAVTATELVGAVLNLYQGRLVNSGIQIDARYASGTRILCFENDIRQVLNNLIANAIDAMRGGGQLRVRAHDAADWKPDPITGVSVSRRGVRITIADTGHGMSPEVRARIFEPFFTTKDLNGTGLGLWISCGIVTHHQGRLTVRSSRDPAHRGSVFSLFLPCAGAGSTPSP